MSAKGPLVPCSGALGALKVGIRCNGVTSYRCFTLYINGLVYLLSPEHNCQARPADL